MLKVEDSHIPTTQTSILLCSRSLRADCHERCTGERRRLALVWVSGGVEQHSIARDRRRVFLALDAGDIVGLDEPMALINVDELEPGGPTLKAPLKGGRGVELWHSEGSAC